MIRRSEVWEEVVLLPMKVRMQREGDYIVVVLPAWVLPPGGIIAKHESKAAAIDVLDDKMREHWGTSSNMKITSGPHNAPAKEITMATTEHLAEAAGGPSELIGVLCAELKGTPHGDVFFRWYTETRPPDRFVEWLYGAFLYGIKYATKDEAQLPDLPDPEDCEHLSFDAYSGTQMRSYGRECAEAQRHLVHKY